MQITDSSDGSIIKKITRVWVVCNADTWSAKIKWFIGNFCVSWEI